jgi:hypothetical protein
MMFAADEREIREWIRFGVPTSRAQSETWREQRDAGALRMPAFDDRLSDSEVDDLVAFVHAVNGSPEPQDSLALAGLETTRRLGCFGCHGAAGASPARIPVRSRATCPLGRRDSGPGPQPHRVRRVGPQRPLEALRRQPGRAPPIARRAHARVRATPGPAT